LKIDRVEPWEALQLQGIPPTADLEAKQQPMTAISDQSQSIGTIFSFLHLNGVGAIPRHKLLFMLWEKFNFSV
jgi:hypothetical protein